MLVETYHTTTRNSPSKAFGLASGLGRETRAYIIHTWRKSDELANSGRAVDEQVIRCLPVGNEESKCQDHALVSY